MSSFLLCQIYILLIAIIYIQKSEAKGKNIVYLLYYCINKYFQSHFNSKYSNYSLFLFIMPDIPYDFWEPNESEYNGNDIVKVLYFIWIFISILINDISYIISNLICCTLTYLFFQDSIKSDRSLDLRYLENARDYHDHHNPYLSQYENLYTSVGYVL